MTAYDTIKILCVFVVLFHSVHQTQIENGPPPEIYSDTATLYKALEGSANVSENIMSVLINRTSAERQLIKILFKKLYELDLTDELNRRLFGDFRKVMVALTIPPGEYYAHELYFATIGLGTDEQALSEILIAMNNSEISAVKEAFKKVYKRSLVESLADDTSGSYRDFLLALCLAQRDENVTIINPNAVLHDAYFLVKASDEQKFEMEDKQIIEIFTRRSFPHIKATLQQYKIIMNKTVSETINSLCSWDYGYALQTLITYMYVSSDEFYARLLNDALMGLGTNDLRLIRIIIARSEIDLDEIQKTYLKIYGHSLISDVKDDTSGTYLTSLVRILEKSLL